MSGECENCCEYTLDYMFGKKHKYKIIKKEHKWTKEHKLKFCGDGEWVDEEDMILIEYLGYEAKINRAFIKEPFSEEEAWFGGHVCGYVKIPENHPYFKKENIDLECHGGITFYDEKVNGDYWIGFDCAHERDYVPTIEFFIKNNKEFSSWRKKIALPEGYEKFSIFNPQYRNVQYCIDQCVEMINQLIKIKDEINVEIELPKDISCP